VLIDARSNRPASPYRLCGVTARASSRLRLRETVSRPQCDPQPCACPARGTHWELWPIYDPHGRFHRLSHGDEVIPLVDERPRHVEWIARLAGTKARTRSARAGYLACSLRDCAGSTSSTVADRPPVGHLCSFRPRYVPRRRRPGKTGSRRVSL